MEYWMRPQPNMRQDLIDLIQHLKSNTRMVEIGSYSGESAEIFCSSDKIVEFNEFYVVKFKANITVEAEDILEQHRVSELDKKYENKEKK